ncbi:MAG: cysteine--tRNA ligase [Cyclobacteriaceae bacterium]|nr:cysteine--tRNA ligase [Cyclobacteriaceae bacterium]
MQLYEKYPVYLTNSLTRNKEKFEPITPGYVGIYLCGPTVYGDPHLGHARSAISFDIVNRYFRHLGYKVRYVRNITDVGHLENDADEGEDKILKKARLEQLEPMQVVQLYTNSYRRAMEQLNVLPPDIEPTATGHIIEQIELTKKILEQGLAYEVNGSVYFDLKKYLATGKYGELSGKVVEDLLVNTRDTEGMEEKRFPLDFALWKKAQPQHIMRWPSPWGEGFPGWHIECTAMSAKYLGVPFDIHGGGMDLQFPHHECEIAQGFGAFGKSPVKYWMHNNMLTIGGQKMAKSLGNFINLQQFFTGSHPLLAQGYSPMTIRFFMLQAHYRSTLDFSNEALQAAEKALKRLTNSLTTLQKMEHPGANRSTELDATLHSYVEQLYQNMSDDFNTAKTLAVLFDMSARINEFKSDRTRLHETSAEAFQEFKKAFEVFIQDVLGLKEETGQDHQLLEGTLRILIELRKKARAERNFALSDKIRDDLKALGIQLMDGKDGEINWTLE